jgi:hypothetical protein
MPCLLLSQSAGKLVGRMKASSSTHQLASAFGFNPYGSFSGSGSTGAKQPFKESEAWWQKTLSLRNTSIALDDILEVSLLDLCLALCISCMLLAHVVASCNMVIVMKQGLGLLG